jgi:hypothetical protein
MYRALHVLLPLVTAASAVAQVSPAAPPPSTPAAGITESSRVARLIAGPGDHPQALILRNGTFVALSPTLSQRLPASLHKGTSLQITGDEFVYDGSKTVQARAITVAGIAYTDDAPAPGMATAPPLPPPSRGAPPPPPPPPPPCGIAGPPAPRVPLPPAPPTAAPPPNPPGQ